MGSLPLSKRAQDCVLVFSFLFARDYCPCFLLFVCKGLLTLFPAICLQITAALFYRYMFVKDCALTSCYSLAEDCGLVSAFRLQRTGVLGFCYSFAKDCGPCLLLFICKELRSLSSLFRTGVLVIYLFANDCCSCFPLYVSKGFLPLFSTFRLQRTAVLVFRYLFAKDCVIVFCFL